MKKNIFIPLLTLLYFMTLYGQETIDYETGIYKFESKSKNFTTNIKLDVDNRTHEILIKNKNGTLVYSKKFSGDYLSASSVYEDLNNDGLIDILLELNDEDSIELFILMNSSNESFNRINNEIVSIDRAKLYFNDSGFASFEYLPYRILDIDNDGIKEIILHNFINNYSGRAELKMLVELNNTIGKVNIRQVNKNIDVYKFLSP